MSQFSGPWDDDHDDEKTELHPGRLVMVLAEWRLMKFETKKIGRYFVVVAL